MGTSNGNKIVMAQYPGYVPTPHQYGIWHSSCYNDQAVQNRIVGSPFFPGLFSDSLVDGVKISSSSNHAVNCNYVSNLGNGFVFENTHFTSHWLGNTMQQTGKGLVLNGGQIGTQGNHLSPSGNIWDVAGSSWSMSNPQTYVTGGSNAINSKLWVAPGLATDPTYNAHGTYGSEYLIYSSIMPVVTSEGPPLCGSASVATVNPIPLGKMARKLDTFNNNTNEHFWMSQFNLWEATTKDPTLADTAGVISAFKNLCTNSRFGFLTGIDSLVANGQPDSAMNWLNNIGLDSMVNTATDTTTGVQMADDPTADTVVQCYRTYYNLYIRYLKNTMSLADTAQVEWLAMQCPFTHGAVVYKARVLHDIINNTQKIFSFDCDGYVRSGDREVGVTSAPVVASNDGQQYALLPNPNNGSSILRQAVADDAPVTIEVLNIVGQSIYRSNPIFLNKTSNLRLTDVSPGLYLLTLKDSKGRNFKLKFVVQ